jgi:hypothetical protein
MSASTTATPRYQVYGFTPGAGDVALSRFGVMFFTDPAAGFANIARGLRPRGRLVFVCWQDLADNEWILAPGGAAQHVTLPPLEIRQLRDRSR